MKTTTRKFLSVLPVMILTLSVLAGGSAPGRYTVNTTTSPRVSAAMPEIISTHLPEETPVFTETLDMEMDETMRGNTSQQDHYAAKVFVCRF